MIHSYNYSQEMYNNHENVNVSDVNSIDSIILLESLKPTNLTFLSSNNSTSVSFNDDDENDVLYQVPLGIVVMLSTFYGGISLAAVTGNGLVLWVVSVSRRMRTVTNMFIANLALADIIIGLFAIPFQFQAALLQRWNLPDFMCAFCPFVQVLGVNVSVFTLSAIAVDRYRAVLYPLSARGSKRNASLAIIAIWSVGIVLALPTELDFKVIEKTEKSGGLKPFCENAGLSTNFRKYYLLGLVVLQYFLPLIIITGAYLHMATRLWGATAPGNAEDTRDAAILRNKKRVIKMLAVVVLLFALCWLPLQTYNFFQPFIPAINNYQYINIIWFCFHWLAMSNSCCNPFIYAIYNDKFQREFRARLRCMRYCSGNRTDSPCSEPSDFDRSKIRASYRFHHRTEHDSPHQHQHQQQHHIRRCRHGQQSYSYSARAKNVTRTRNGGTRLNSESSRYENKCQRHPSWKTNDNVWKQNSQPYQCENDLETNLTTI